MKNVKYLGFVGLGCAALVLTGCGQDSHTLTCTLEKNNESQKFVLEFNDQEDTLINANVHMASAIPDGTSDEEIEKTKTKIESMYCATGFLENCKVSVNESDIEFLASVSAEGLKDETIKGTKEELKKKFENQGYACK